MVHYTECGLNKIWLSRFIRKELGLSQAALASVPGNDAQSIARWEKGGRIPKMAERFVRALYGEHTLGNARIGERIGQLDRRPETRLVFEETGGAWAPAKAA
jgi:DNA-binding XRE family transcriptional regulator